MWRGKSLTIISCKLYRGALALKRDEKKYLQQLNIWLEKTHIKKVFFSGRTTKVLPFLH